MLPIRKNKNSSRQTYTKRNFWAKTRKSTNKSITIIQYCKAEYKNYYS